MRTPKVSLTDWDNLKPDGTRYRQRKEANELLGKRSGGNTPNVPVDLAGGKMPPRLNGEKLNDQD